MSVCTISDNYREVCFDKYCESCEYAMVKEGDELYLKFCDKCLDEPFRQYTEKPLNYTKK